MLLTLVVPPEKLCKTEAFLIPAAPEKFWADREEKDPGVNVLP
ncbi:protein of unknown function [Candidatus Nitrosacidococcus tergens]|uniref:Uncharacterized protein n=1 Tax=Candidatus Nitrosacidococcus tergens TaxID=553981 RepID=A0A7G1QA34_9GAMM|nr:protein of unknown function [Candidatus Nitrosacidococcus tergens]